MDKFSNWKTKISSRKNPALVCSQDAPQAKTLREFPSCHSPSMLLLPNISLLSSFSNPTNWTLLLLWRPKVDLFFCTLSVLASYTHPPPGICLPTPNPEFPLCLHFLLLPLLTPQHPLASHMPGSSSPLARYIFLQHAYHFYMLYDLKFLYFIIFYCLPPSIWM